MEKSSEQQHTEYQELDYNEQQGYTLEFKGAEPEPFCFHCGSKIKGEIPYFCNELKIFFHKECLLNDKRHIAIIRGRFRRSTHHFDHPISRFKKIK